MAGGAIGGMIHGRMLPRRPRATLRQVKHVRPGTSHGRGHAHKAFHVKADIPGVRKEDIQVKVEGNVVRIDAETKSEKETRGNGDKVLRSERQYGAISHTFSLGQDVDEQKVQAKYAGGVLSLDLPKKAADSSARIVIQ